jgi:Cytochrome P450
VCVCGVSPHSSITDVVLGLHDVQGGSPSLCQDCCGGILQVSIQAHSTSCLGRHAGWVILNWVSQNLMQVASQINTFLLAGYETTASALAFTVYHVARCPDKEAKLLAEIDAFGRSRAPTLEDLDQVGKRAFAAAALCTCGPAAQSASRVRANQQPADAV